MQKIAISQEASDRKGNLNMPENMGFLAPKKKLRPEGWLFYWFGKNIPLHEMIVNLRIKVEFESTPVSFWSFVPFHPEQPTKKIISEWG